ncbi:hypothetical protein PVK06_007070 [Gossypium arboreum]|uniref:Uncharacterized protein n=1 Tax=Gossypium arboreum TaxID=29729 RepID=A0ABR0QH39_GOSAR|nr:hypothetical protein PVK06_007070 [Gossypium arboreum]
MADSLSKLTLNLKEWNKQVYGYIITKKRHLVCKIVNVQSRMDFSCSNNLAQVDLNLKQDLENVLHHEELLYKQKVRRLWTVLLISLYSVLYKLVMKVHVFHSKYHLKKDLPDCIARDISSFLWRSLSKIWLSDDVIQLIKGIPPLHPSAGSDKISWSHTSVGVFQSNEALKADDKGSFKSLVEEDSFEDLIFLNTDGAVQLESGNAAAG